MLTCFHLFSHSHNIEKKIKQTSSEHPDSTRIKAYVDLSNHFLDLNRDSSFLYIKKGGDLINALFLKTPSSLEDKNIVFLSANLFQTAGYYFFKENKPEEAIKNFEKALDLFKQIDSRPEIADNTNNLAVIYKHTGNSIKSIHYNNSALSIYEEINNAEGVANVLNNLSAIYREQGEIDEAIIFTNKALKINRQTNNKLGEAKSLNALAGLTKTFGDTVGALRLYETSLSIYKEIKNKAGQAKVLNNIGVIHKNKKEYKEALTCFRESIELSEKLNYVTGVGFASVNIGELYFEQGDFETAILKGEEAKTIGESLNNVLLIKRGTELLKKAYYTTNQWKKAFKNQEVYMEVSQKLLNEETKRVATQEALKYAYETEKTIEKKESERQKAVNKEREQRQKTLNYGVGLLLIILLIIIVFIVHRLRLSKAQNKKIFQQSEERKILLQEIHHRVKNNFQVVSSLLRLQSHSIDDPKLQTAFEEAVHRINAMALVHDIIYKQDAFSEINTKEYLEKLTQQLKEISKFNKVDIKINTENFHFQVETLIHIGLVLNELTINSFKHGFDADKKDPKIQVDLFKKGDNYFLEYKENGSGINLEDYKTSFGMELIETVIDQQDGKVFIESEDYWKTKITIRFKEESQ